MSGEDPGDPRARLAAQQAALVAALLDAGPVPDGFDADAVARTGRALAHKRQKDAARHAARPEAPSADRRPGWLRRLLERTPSGR